MPWGGGRYRGGVCAYQPQRPDGLTRGGGNGAAVALDTAGEYVRTGNSSQTCLGELEDV